MSDPAFRTVVNRPCARGDNRPRRTRLFVAATLAAAIFCIDTFTQLSSAVAVLYVVVLLIAEDALSRRAFYMVAAGCAALTVVSFVRIHGGAPAFASLLRFLVSLSALGVTAALILRNVQSRHVLQAQARLLEVTHDAIFTCGPDRGVAFWNLGAQQLYGWSREDVLGRDVHAMLRSRFPTPLADIRAQLEASGRWEGEIVQQRRDGTLITVLSRWSLEFPLGSTAATILETNTDITARKAADEALMQSEMRYRHIFNSLAISIWEHDFRPAKAALEALRAEGISDLRGFLATHPSVVREICAQVLVTDVNATALKLMGMADKAEFLGSLSDLLPESDESFEQCLVALDEGHPTFEAETTVRSRTGELIPVIVALSFPPDRAGLERVQASVLNITERRRMQERLDSTRAELDQALRSATLGELSASIAHEVNQPISAIRTYADATLRWLTRDPPNVAEARAALDDVILAANHTSEVVKRVRNLIRQAPSDLAPIGLDTMVAQATRLVQRDVQIHEVSLVLDLQAPAAVLVGDRVLLQQTLINLMMNGVQAMVSASSLVRRLTLRTRAERDQVIIEIADTGPGFPPAASKRAFDAFFTTKPGGMGLGLAICRSTIKAHKGEIRIIAAAEGGATVQLKLPLAASLPPLKPDGDLAT